MEWVLYFVGRQVRVKEEFKVTSEVDVEVMHLGHFWTIGEAGLVDMSILDMCEKLFCRLTVRSGPFYPFFFMIQFSTVTLVCNVMIERRSNSAWAFNSFSCT